MRRRKEMTIDEYQKNDEAATVSSRGGVAENNFGRRFFAAKM